MKTSPQLNSTRAWIICSLGIVFYTYEFLLRIAPSVMEPQLRDFFTISATGFGSLIGIYYFIYTPMQIVVGPLLDILGARIILTLAMIICALGNLIFALSDHLYWAGAGRFALGFGSAFAFVGAMKLAAVWLPANRFATFAGLVTGLSMVGGMVGDIGLTVIIKHIGWQATLVWGSVIGLIFAPFLAIFIRNIPAGKTAQAVHIKPNEIVSELKNIVKKGQIWLAGFIALILYLSLSAFAEMWGIPFLKSTGATATQAATLNSMIFLGWLIGSPLIGWFSDYYRKRRLPILIGSVGAALAIAALIYVPTHNFIIKSLLLFLFGFFSSAEIICFALAYEKAERRVAATAVAFVNMITMAGGFIFQPLIGKLLDLVWVGPMMNGVREYTLHDYRLALLSLPIAMVVSALCSLFIKESHEIA